MKRHYIVPQNIVCELGQQTVLLADSANKCNPTIAPAHTTSGVEVENEVGAGTQFVRSERWEEW